MRHGQFALAQGFSYQAEVQHLQVAQTAVEHLGGAAGGAACEVTSFNDRSLQTTGCGIERSASAYRTAADNDDVVLLGTEFLPGLFMLFLI